MANHRKFTMTFDALRTTDVANEGGFTYNRTQKHGTTQIRGHRNLALAASLYPTAGTHAGKVRLAGDNDPLIGVPENMESDNHMSVMTSGVVEIPIGNDANGVAYTVTIGEPVVGALGSSHLGHEVTDRAAAVSSSTQRRGHVRGIDSNIELHASGNTPTASSLNDVIRDANARLLEMARGARAICIGTRTAAASRTFNGTAIVMFL